MPQTRASFPCLVVTSFALSLAAVNTFAEEGARDSCQGAPLNQVEVEVAELAQQVGQELRQLDENMPELATKPSLMFERSQAYWVKSRKAACNLEDAKSAEACLCETGVARRSDLAQMHDALSSTVSDETAQ